jgi:hypothetical protein
MSAAKSKCLIINYLGTDYLYPYPVVELSIKDFITRFLEDNDIETTVQLGLFNENVSLTPSYTLQFFGIQMGQRLELKPLQNNKPLVIRIQTLSGQERQYTLDDGKTMRDLYETIKIDRNLSSFTETFPMLFNHRMHVMESDELLGDYLKLSNFIDWETSRIPHFYLFECSRQFEAYAYNYQSGSRKEILYAEGTWQPISCEKQTDNAMSIFLLSLYALTSFYGTNPDTDFDNRNETPSFHFLTVLRQTLFPPACLAFKHLMEGGLFLFEKQVLSEALYRLFRECLPEDIPNEQVFLYTPYMFCMNIQKAQLISKEHDDYKQDILRGVARGGALGACAPLLEKKSLEGSKDLKTYSQNKRFSPLAPLRKFLATPLVILCKLCSRDDTEHDVHTYFTNPVIRLGNSGEYFELDELETKSTEAKNTYIDQTDLKVFMKWLNNYGEQRIPSKIT